MRLRIFGGFPPMSKLICTLLEQRCAKRCCVAECCLGPLALRRAYFGFLVLPHTKEVYGKEWRSKSDSPSNSRCFVQNKETHILWLLWPLFALLHTAFYRFKYRPKLQCECMKKNKNTVLQSVMNSKRSHKNFWPYHQNVLVKNIFAQYPTM